MTDRVTLRADDAIIAMIELRSSIERLDEMSDFPSRDEIRAENFAAYERICKALRLKATVSCKSIMDRIG